MKSLVALCFLVIFLTFVGHSQIQFSEREIDLGAIPEAYEIKGNLIFTNTSAKKVFLLRADADKGLKIYTSKKTLLPGDTCLLVISFIPERKGKFNKNIQLITSERKQAYQINFSGNLLKALGDDKTACYYFGSRKNNIEPVKDNPVLMNDPFEKRDNSNRIPDRSSEQFSTYTVSPKNTQSSQKKIPDELPASDYKPNNIIFVVDVSGSMKDSLKLPLMKIALHTLINAVRDIDRITLVTYADSVKIIREALSGSDKKTLNALVDALKAKGLTKGNKAILFSQLVAQKHFIASGNNQVFLATDGKFKFYADDFKTWTERQHNKKVILSTIAFGNDREAIKVLKEIAEKCEGSFIHIKRKNESENKLLDEIKLRSKVQ